MLVQAKYKGREFFYDEGSALIFSEKNGKMTLAIEDQDGAGILSGRYQDGTA